ncbi:uncharacterized protein N7473_007710 [Penicillium subrubescens]|uniref:Uncharacterized protein n=1 Tax=Penicillium subrubescens TaxID=1316194 RepID=A0A1Q5UG01_9EURO|nr:uncharacterized protein N7473_007710 [Penicillium subrubescens]KAJ5891482.1 hypothetical protein N7473_007710 [Penicillium subrubescens]OKP11394.1 hypothetical protein PENSUB_3086 [Penicillium subrubescens]
MSIPEPSSSSSHNPAGSSLSQNNVSQVPRSNQNSVNRFARAPAADGPYYAGARMGERSTHMNGLSNQVNAMDDILKSK